MERRRALLGVADIVGSPMDRGVAGDDSRRAFSSRVRFLALATLGLFVLAVLIGAAAKIYGSNTAATIAAFLGVGASLCGLSWLEQAKRERFQ